MRLLHKDKSTRIKCRDLRWRKLSRMRSSKIKMQKRTLTRCFRSTCLKMPWFLSPVSSHFNSFFSLLSQIFIWPVVVVWLVAVFSKATDFDDDSRGTRGCRTRWSRERRLFTWWSSNTTKTQRRQFNYAALSSKSSIVLWDTFYCQGMHLFYPHFVSMGIKPEHVLITCPDRDPPSYCLSGAFVVALWLE